MTAKQRNAGRAKSARPTISSTIGMKRRTGSRRATAASVKNASAQGLTSDAVRRASQSGSLPESITKLKHLGSGKTKYSYDGADARLLERFPNPSFREYGSRLPVQKIIITAPEFTSLCPKTGQPDFATVLIDYTPSWWCVESKSLKLYLGSFRQHGAFHEAVVKKICADLIELLQPHYIRVTGQFSARGGITFHPVSDWYLDPEDFKLLKVEGLTNGTPPFPHSVRALNSRGGNAHGPLTDCDMKED